ncbi:MAG: iron-containing alcohol dehydrogenase [Lachnospiraceae bacterium]|nr:iron-containing alcohol dehydrogenase [Lachnospiraceae bacterium]
MWNPQGIYTNFILKQPVIFHGEEAFRGLFDFPGNRIAVIYGNGMSDNAQQLIEGIFKHRSLCFIKKSWKDEPSIDELDMAVKQLEEFNPDIIVAIGGGSVIDGAKLCRICFEFPYIDWKTNRLSQMVFKTRFIAVPTTLGSGAEASSAAVYYSKGDKTKKMAVCHALQPEVVIFDPEYVKNAPASILYPSIADALAHMIEGYVSNIRNPFAEEMAVWGISIIRQEMEQGSKDKIDFMRLQYAGYLGGIVQNHCLVGATHAFAHQLTSYGFSHGKAVSLLLLRTIQMNQKNKEVEKVYQELAKKSGFSNIDSMLFFLQEFIHHVEKENTQRLGNILSNCLLDKDFIQNVKSDPGGRGNPVPITERYIEEFIGDFNYELFSR